MKQYSMEDDVLRPLYTKEEIAQVVQRIGDQITQDYADAYDEGIILVCVLRGAAIFMSDLARVIDLPTEMDYMVVSSYGNSTKSSGVVSIVKDLSSSIEDRHVIIAEDILDSGLTLSYLMKLLATRHPKSLTVATLLRKDRPDQADVNCRYTGFVCPDEFIIGYGLDYAERYRNLPYIGVLKPEIYEK